MRCPSCGWSNTLKNYPRKKLVLKKHLNPELLEKLEELFLSKLEPLNAYTLLHTAKDVEDEVLKHCINVWINRNLAEKGFDVYYFIGILRNESKKFDEKLKLEKNNLEELPPNLE